MQHDRRFGRGQLVALLSIAPVCADAFTVSIVQGPPRTVYLQIGVGTFTGGTYNAGGQPANNPTINKVTVTVPAAAVGNGIAQAMTTDSAVGASSYDGRAFCNAPTQLYIAGFYRTPGAGPPGSASVTATVPGALTDATGDTLSFSQISWTSGGTGDSGGEPFPGGTFVAGGVQTVGIVGHNEWDESCWTFSYSNTTAPAAGVYTGTVLYTLTSP